jgi:hypothetical protein
VNNNRTEALVDTGAVISCITEQHLRKLIIHYKLELPRIPFVRKQISCWGCDNGHTVNLSYKDKICNPRSILACLSSRKSSMMLQLSLVNT